MRKIVVAKLYMRAERTGGSGHPQQCAGAAMNLSEVTLQLFLLCINEAACFKAYLHDFA
jgi:hypothetical protein